MATMEKTKKDRSKKSRSKQKLIVLPNEEDEEEQESEDKEPKQYTDKVKEIPEIMCATVHENISKITDKTDDDTEVNNFDKITITAPENDSVNKEQKQQQVEKEEEIENHEPSAPPADIQLFPVITTLPSPPVVVQYPNLQPLQLQYVESKSEIIYQSKRQSKPQFLLDSNQSMTPLTEDQLRELYSCAELDLVNQFELEFLMNSLLETNETDPLHILLQEYYDLHSKLSMIRHDVEQCRTEAQQAKDNIWIKEPINKSFSARCLDGTTVTHNFTYDVMQVDGERLQTTSDRLQQLFELVCYRYTTNSVSASITKVKITDIIDKIIMQPPLVVMANISKKIKLNKSLDNDIIHCVTHIRRATSIIFTFIRKLSPSREFTNDLRAWLSKLVSMQLLIATKEDHWFLLFNLLRCPSGVGNWAAPLLHVPCSNIATENIISNVSKPSQAPWPLNSAELNHCIAVLHILLLPIKKRNDYLQAHKDILDPVKDDCWTLVDSDGEDSHTSTGELNGLRESDLLAFFSQIPFEQVFMSALNAEKFLNDYILQAEYLTSHDMLRTIAFFSKLITIFGEGMVTYNKERYKQLAKRLGRLLRQTLQYATDLNELFIQNKMTKDALTCERIAIELNVLLFRACSYIYCTRNLATWQYFSSLPFRSLRTETLFQIFYYLNVGFPSEYPTEPQANYAELLAADDFWIKFNIANADSSPEDLYYLLQAFFEMASERDRVKDWELIKAICLQIFHIGFINHETREICYKASRDMLVNLTLIHEELMSCLLLQLKIRFSDIENASYLFKSLPLDIWRPGMDSFDLLSNWLLHYDFRTAESMLARLIISHLNWGFESDGGRLFLPHNIHVRMACLVSEALTKQAPEVIGIASFTESVRQVTQLLDYKQTSMEDFSTWCWSMVSLLRLHLMDQSAESIKHTMINPAETLLFVHDLERIDLIYQGVTEKRPLSIYVALLISLHGHSIPLICQKGFDLLKQLLNDNRHAAVIRFLELTVPMFLSTPETLANCEGFQSIIMNLLYADKTYVRLAKSALYSDSVGPVLQLLDNMIHHQITNYTDYGLATPLNLINIWLNCLTNLPSWQNSSVVHLLDHILCVAYQFPDARPQAVEFFKNYYKDCDEWKGNNKKSALKSLFGTSCFRLPQLSPQQPWLAAVLLEIENNTQDALFWAELLRQLATNENNNPMEGVLKKTTATLKISNFQPSMLVVYKYATFLSNMKVNHALFPILSQKFFELYLSRVPLTYDDHRFQTTYGISDKLYEFNVPLMKKVKANLIAAETYYSNEALKVADDEGLTYFYGNCAKMMKTYALWLEETNINKFSKDDQNLPPQYNIEKLKEILNGNTSHWTEFIYLPTIRNEQRNKALEWARLCLRTKSTMKNQQTPPKSKISTSTALDRIKMQLGSYDKIQSPPAYKKPELNIPKDINMKTFKHMKEMLTVLNTSAKKFHYQTCELSSLVRNYLELIPQLYVMQSYTQVYRKNCGWVLQNCKGPASIEATLEKACVNNEVQEKLNNYCTRHEKIIDEMLVQQMQDLVHNHQQLAEIIRLLLVEHAAAPNKLKIVTTTGIQFFYEIVESLNDVTIKFPTTMEFYTQILQDLGTLIQDNQNSEGLNILKLALKRPDLAKTLYGVFMPSRTSAEYFIPMYEFLIDSYLQRCDTKILFVLLSKFDLSTWLEAFKPKLNDINQVLLLVLRGLECWSKSEASLLQDQFRRHLVHIFNYDFPQHYGEVMQLLLDRISDQKLMPDVLLDALNALLLRFNCTALTLNTNYEQVLNIAVDFSRRQNLFNLQASTDTCLMFARHFQRERLQHGLHGLYPKHKDYCTPLAMWFTCFGHVVVTMAIYSYQNQLADQICDTVFGHIMDMYKPWLIPYTEQNLPQETSNWMRQLREQGQILLPWSEQYAGNSRTMIKSLIHTLNFVLEHLPTSHRVLDHTFSWYVHHFAIINMEKHIHVPIQEGIATLPWERFRPQLQYIDMLYDSLQKFIPECHAMLGHIFIRINWNAWVAEVLPTFHTTSVQIHAMSRLFNIFVKIAFEPNIHMHTNLSRILEDAMQYPWHLVSYAELEILFKWFVSTVDPCIILKMPIETNYADRAVLDLLQLVSGLRLDQPNFISMSHATAKRILYVRSYVQQMRLCAAKNQKLVANKEGANSYKGVFLELLRNLDKTLKILGNTQTHEECRREALNLLIEIIVPMQTQSEQISNLHIDAIINWQQECSAGNVLLVSALNAVGHMKVFIAGIYNLLESTIAHYFRTSEETRTTHTPSWSSLLRELHMSLEKLDLMSCIQGAHCYTLHIFIIYHFHKITNNGDKITFLQNLCQLIQPIKTNPATEARMVIVWGLMISRGSQILLESPLVKKPLLMLARNLHVLSSESEGWGESLLGAIGLMREKVTNKRRILTRCLACVIFSLFPNINSANELLPNQEFNSALHELSMLLANKKFFEFKSLIVQAIGIINENRTPTFSDVPHLVARLIGLFYRNDFLTTIPEVWDFEFKLT